MGALTKPIVYERGDLLYMVGPLVPSQPTDSEIEEYAFGKQLVQQARQHAPNPHIAWFSGHYVEADIPNANGAMWTGKDIAIASITPNFMPVTVMHDPRQSVGLIADASLKTPDNSDAPRSKIDTALAVWKHRYPEIAEEALANYTQGTLMQSMECLAPSYDCSVCGMNFVKLPEQAEKNNWCDHLKASDPSAGIVASDAGAGTPNASRILRGVTFTGTGLIFGTRGAEGADPNAHLEAFQEEVAEFHQKVHRDQARTARATRTPTRSKRRMDDITIPKSEYDELRGRPSKDEFDALRERAETAERNAEQAEAAKATAEERAQAAETKVTEAEEKANRATLKQSRIDALGSAFVAKLETLPNTKSRLHSQAEMMQDDEWHARLDEVAEMIGVKPDEAKADDGKGDGGKDGERAGKGGDGTFTREEVARSRANGASGSGGNGSGTKQTPEARRSLLSGLVKGSK